MKSLLLYKIKSYKFIDYINIKKLSFSILLLVICILLGESAYCSTDKICLELDLKPLKNPEKYEEWLTSKLVNNMGFYPETNKNLCIKDNLAFLSIELAAVEDNNSFVVTATYKKSYPDRVYIKSEKEIYNKTYELIKKLLKNDAKFTVKSLQRTSFSANRIRRSVKRVRAIMGHAVMFNIQGDGNKSYVGFGLELEKWNISYGITTFMGFPYGKILNYKSKNIASWDYWLGGEFYINYGFNPSATTMFYTGAKIGMNYLQFHILQEKYSEILGAFLLTPAVEFGVDLLRHSDSKIRIATGFNIPIGNTADVDIPTYSKFTPWGYSSVSIFF